MDSNLWENGDPDAHSADQLDSHIGEPEGKTDAQQLFPSCSSPPSSPSVRTLPSKLPLTSPHFLISALLAQMAWSLAGWVAMAGHLLLVCSSGVPCIPKRWTDN